jgi:tRNA-splicing ligase RtcB
MDTALLSQKSEYEWWVSQSGKMRVPAVIYASEQLVKEMDEKVHLQLTNVASLPGIVQAAYAMPDAHWGYGFPIGGVAAFDPDQEGVLCAGGVGFDISCGVRTLRTGLTIRDIGPVQDLLADALFHDVPAGLGSTGKFRLNADEIDAMLRGGARWAVELGFGSRDDLNYVEEHGAVAGAVPEHVSEKARHRQQEEMGTLGSGNHYLEVQAVDEVYEPTAAQAYGLKMSDVVVSMHCGSRGLGHQTGTEFLSRMLAESEGAGITLPDRELASAPIHSPVGQEYLGAMRSAINCALANRQIITYIVRQTIQRFFPGIELPVLYDVSHNTCKVEAHLIEGAIKDLYVHRKGATRALGPGHPSLPASYQDVGQPVIIGGTMGTASYILAGTPDSADLAFASSCHGAGRSMSRHQAAKHWTGREIVDNLAQQRILIRSRSYKGVAEEAPGAYKDVSEVTSAADGAGLSRKVVKLRPLICVKG